MKIKLNIKQKATFSILLLISILLLTLYFQNKTSNKNYLIQIENAYKKSFDNIHTLFEKKLIDHYEMATKNIEEKDFKIKLYSSHKFLKNIEVKDINTTTIYTNKLSNGQTILDVFANNKKEVFYKLLVPIKKEEKINSYAQYIVDIRVFLDEIKEFDGSNGIVYIIDNDKSNDIYLKEYYESEVFKFMVEECPTDKRPVIEVQDEFYVKKDLEIKNIEGTLVANAIFFLDVTKEKKDYISTVRTSIFTSILLFIFAAVIVNYFFNSLIKKINKKEEALRKINKNLEQTVENEIKHRLEVQQTAQEQKQKSEQLLMQQSKLALLGEMIGNIAHQWRQPLMQLSAILMYFDAYNEKGKLTPERFEKKLKEGNLIIDFMSKTIEDFRNYYKPEKQKEEFLLKDSVDSALFIINSSLKTSNIKVDISNIDENIKLFSYKNEFSQALLNIITNAKDILNLRKTQNGEIKIKAKEENDHIIISVEDNAGGIEEENIKKVFDPYFTTKHKSQGTGIGLYMTKMIVENNMDGSIEVSNSSEGARFTIRLKA